MDVDKILEQRRAFQRAKFHGRVGDPSYPHEGGGGGGESAGKRTGGGSPGKAGGSGSWEKGLIAGDVVQIKSKHGSYNGTVQNVEPRKGYLNVHTPGGRMGGGSIEMFHEDELTFVKPGGANWWLRPAGT
jgi:hypothetical protein